MRSTEAVIVTAVISSVVASGGCRSKPALSPVELVLTVEAPATSAAEVETSVTNVLEEVLARVPHLVQLRSQSSAGHAELHLQLEPSSEVGLVQQSVVDAIAPALTQLPPTVGRPVVSRGEGPVVARYLLTSSELSVTELSQFAETTVVRSIETIAGVGVVERCGARMPIVEVVVDPTRMTAFAIDVPTVVDVLSHASGGKVDQLADTLVRQSAQGTIRVRDVATVSMSSRTPSCTAYHRGLVAIEVIVHAQHDADAGEVAAAVTRGFGTLSIPGSIKIVAAKPSTPVDVRVIPGTRLESTRRIFQDFEVVTITQTLSRDIAHVDRQRMVGLRVRAADVTSLPEMKPGMSIRLVHD